MKRLGWTSEDRKELWEEDGQSYQLDMKRKQEVPEGSEVMPCGKTYVNMNGLI